MSENSLSLEEFYAHLWHKKWSDEILNAPELSSRRMRSHDLKMISLDRENGVAVFQSERMKNEEYNTTLTYCTCIDFMLGHRKRPCKHMFRLAEELGLLQSEGLLPEALRNAEKELVDKYLTILRFLFLGRKEHIKNLKKKLLDQTDNEEREKTRKKIQAYQEFSGEAREIKQYKLEAEHDELLDRLIELGLIETISKEVTVTVRLASKMTLDNISELMKVYGSNITFSVPEIAENPFELLSGIIFSGQRSDQILRPYDAMDTPKWQYHVPKYFNDALDIKLTTKSKNNVKYMAWTQGINFAFDTGDMIYRDSASHEKGTPSLQVISAMTANEGYPGEVKYRNFESGGEETKTQVGFVKMLIGENN